MKFATLELAVIAAAPECDRSDGDPPKQKRTKVTLLLRACILMGCLVVGICAANPLSAETPDSLLERKRECEDHVKSGMDLWARCAYAAYECADRCQAQYSRFQTRMDCQESCGNTKQRCEDHWYGLVREEKQSERCVEFYPH